LELKVGQAMQEVEQFGRTIGLLMIDIDKFKQVNDTYGHETGDVTLRTICNTLSHNMRPGDTVGRWGGEEFLVLTVDVNDGGLATVAERCRHLIAESAVPIGSEHLQVTASLGATLLQHGESADAAIQRADQLMYKSKVAGRNRATVG
jgi:diguanylate cyclase (GGDEF)-like protein